MFDNITLKLYKLPRNYIPCENVEVIFRSDVNTFRGKIRNMGIYKNLNCLIIYGSLAKYLQGENITPLNKEKVKQAIEKLEQDIGLNLNNSVVASAEFGTSIITKEKPFEYLGLFGYVNRLKRSEISERTGVETITYFSRTGSFEFVGYDKVKEMLDKKQDIPPLFAKSNVLRLEYRIRKKRGIEAKFKGGLSAYSLFDKEVYNKFQRLFFDTYKSIDKMGQLVYADKSKKITPAKFRILQAEQYRQSFPKDYRYFIQQLKASGKLSFKDLERIRAENHKWGNDIHILEQSTLIKELDALVYDRVMYGA
jgi:hypothetical protein